MGAYQQMGHHSHNLMTEVDLQHYAGIVASPVDYPETELASHIATAKFRRGFDVVFDPQLYVPSTARGKLKTWTYFPADVDTADVASDDWWETVVRNVVAAATRLKAGAVCSPAVIPRMFSDQYFERLLFSGAVLKRLVRETDLRPMQTLMVSLPELADRARAMTIASAASASDCKAVYLVLVSDTVPRREFSEPEELKGALRLIASLRGAGMEVFVAFSSSDVVLWRAAGATHCGTGKFFNLRRFTRSRFDDPSEGGGQLPYWFEESLLAFLRTSDLQRIQRIDLLSAASLSNPYTKEIFAAIPQDRPWIALAWRHYLYWFADVQSRIEAGTLNVAALLETAEKNWRRVKEAQPEILMEEQENDGAWLRQWRRALLEYPFQV